MGKYCTHKYYGKFCCKSCTLAGQLPSVGPHLDALKRRRRALQFTRYFKDYLSNVHLLMGATHGDLMLSNSEDYSTVCRNNKECYPPTATVYVFCDDPVLFGLFCRLWR
ncbi:hypothetical protein J6590_054756 [Homalodisca vitripennis]|nr:hypothetical protein J6590_054756 [Homalodisca vitripennis]